jgi:hypothetical protein
VSGTLEKLGKQGPATADEAARSMQTMLKGLVGAAGRTGPLFAVTVQSENVDQAEAVLEGTVAVVGAGTPGRKLEPIEGSATAPTGSELVLGQPRAGDRAGAANAVEAVALPDGTTG